MLFTGALIGQDNGLTIVGKISDCKTNQGVQGVLMRVVGSDQSIIEVTTDSSGNYLFTNCFRKETKYLLGTKVDNIVGEHKGLKYGSCTYGWCDDYCFFNSSRRYEFVFSDSTLNHHFDDCLVSYYQHINFTEFNFKKNSSDLFATEWLGLKNVDSIIDCFVGLLMLRKNWVIELSANVSSDEELKVELSKERAKKIYQMLISKGIEQDRLVLNVYKDEIYNLAKVNKENDDNRSVSISVLRKDYISPNSTK